MTTLRNLGRFLAVCTIMAAFITAAPALASTKAHTGDGSLDPNTRFYIPPPNHDAIRQIAKLIASRNKADARLIAEMIATPQAVWFTKGTPKSVRQDVKLTVKLAAATHTVPVLVAYNIPFRDCAQFSAGGATSVQEYKTWIDAFAAGIGNSKAVVILEPDGLGIIPWYNPYGSADEGNNELDWCQPAEADSATAAAERFTMLNYAVDALKARPNISVYLDGTHSAWLGVGDAAHRLVQAGVERADGFYLNVSNYQFTANSIQYGTWVSSCIAFATTVAPGNFFGCPNQYWNGGPLPTKIAQLLGEWTGVALNAYGEWSDTTDDASLNTSGINWRYADMLGATQPTTHFVIDTSRNGLGPWQPPAGVYPDSQDWCNPPDRGLGLRPTADTSIELLDAYLWVKIPGESDGECTRGLGPSGTTVDPEWGQIDPPAGQWFPDMALELARNANPPLH
jgi:endoglucanase